MTGTRTWRDPGWRAAALGWAAGQLERAGLVPGGEPEQPHVRAWSTAFRIPLRGGEAVWLKAVGPGSAQEPVLAEALAVRVPERVLVPLAVDRGRRLLLLPDGGPTLREAGADLAAWTAMLVAHARLQAEVADHADGLVALGVPDHRPERLPALVADLLADGDAQQAGRPDGLAPEVRARVLAGTGRYAAACRELADGGVPATVQHDDLHDGNVFAGGGGYRFFDWGDASISHPFLVLLVVLRFAGQVLDLSPGHPALFRLRDAYLDQWLDHGTPAELRELCDQALHVAPLQRALTWRRILRGVHEAERTEWAGAVPGWTAEHLAPGPLAPGG
ncbi:aminoglycoside phosphotransferase family protein [Blastococcus sp. MG754426]|uniref:phosphotransferase n=1 Tax=Blastococcus sp. MG754426 TaxID=2570317 RepID=UPI001F467324|nr:phosphotransferase [Blastococcus sp. MG754426]MCF6508279.1 aminoglycoside phosphotransferase family protein [Blastococcus sp. MG754426]